MLNPHSLSMKTVIQIPMWINLFYCSTRIYSNLINCIYFNSGFLQVDIWMLESGLFTQMFVCCQTSEAAAQYTLFKEQTVYIEHIEQKLNKYFITQ